MTMLRRFLAEVLILMGIICCMVAVFLTPRGSKPCEKDSSPTA